MFLGRHVGGRERIVAHHPHRIGGNLGLHSYFVQLAHESVEVRGIASRHVHVSARHGGGNDERARFDAVRNDAVLRAIQLADAFHAHRRRTRAFNLRSHLVEQIGEIGDFRFTRAILENRFAVRERCGHKQVFCTGYRDLVEDDLSAFQSPG